MKSELTKLRKLIALAFLVACLIFTSSSNNLEEMAHANISSTGSQAQPSGTQECLRCKYRCGQDRQDCLNLGLTPEECEVVFNECVEETCNSTGICPPN
jgi:hypothetical protein